jgi:hypothetical protein
MDTVVDATGQRFRTASGKDYGMDGSDIRAHSRALRRQWVDKALAFKLPLGHTFFLLVP